MLSRLLLLTSICLTSILFADEVIVNLKDPVFVQGVLKTDQGGVITAPGLRIQGQCIEYTNRVENGVLVKKIVAEGDLMLTYQDRAFVGKRLEFDLLTNTGTLLEGKTFVDIWFLGGERIDLRCDGSYMIYSGYISTCESQDNAWEIRAHNVKITRDCLLSAKDISLRFIKVPVLWLPALRGNLRFFKDSPIRFKVLWDTKLGPRLSMRYRIYSWEHFRAYLRFDYRIERGPGLALETEYQSEDENTLFLTKSYGAYDKSFPNEEGNKRYRLQGLFEKYSEDEKTTFHLQWDKFSDERMVSDFRSGDFEINTRKRNYLFFEHKESQGFGSINVEPKLNRFQTLNEQLPYAVAGLKPFDIWKSGVIFENYVSGGYLDYDFNDQMQDVLRNRHSGRLETKQSLYRPILAGPVTITPKVGFVGIYYSNNPFHEPISQAVFTYGGEITTRIFRRFETQKHMIQPYLHYLGYTRPMQNINDHFVFNINDGYTRLDLLKIGVKNAIFNVCRSPFLPTIETDIFTYGFFGARSFHQAVPKIYGSVALNRSHYSLKGEICWNLQQKVLDYGNCGLLWTINDAFAFGLEFRHRSRYDFRKAEKFNFVVDFARSLSELVISPLSDRRNTFLTKAHVRFSPRWSLQFESHHGWGRSTEPGYTSIKTTLFTMLTCSWQLQTAYEYLPNDPFRFSFKLNLLK
ncbi:MAG TPA: hypothetical protein VLG76_02265 [Rhabdochlamydiaceae bacterium]|nr:hypothetical protein [Rhabdochlamydiaceae bacterium]